MSDKRNKNISSGYVSSLGSQVNKLKLNKLDLLSASFISGSGTNNQIAVWNNNSTISGSNELLFNNSILYNSVGYLILSSSNSIIHSSGSHSFHKILSASLPLGSDNLSGSVIWLNDKKCFVGYGPEGWTRFLSSSL